MYLTCCILKERKVGRKRNDGEWDTQKRYETKTRKKKRIEDIRGVRNE